MTLDHVPVAARREATSEQLAALEAWCSAWMTRLYGANPWTTDGRRSGLRMPVPEGDVWMKVEVAHEAVGETVVAVLRTIRRRSRRSPGPLPAADVPRLANWYLPRRVVDQIRQAVKLRPVEDAELAKLRPRPTDMADVAIDTIGTCQAMRAIAPSDRRAISLEVCGFDGAERAQHQRISLVAERKRLSRARANVRAA